MSSRNGELPIPCTAADSGATDDSNVLFNPPCQCPRCAPEPAAAPDGQDLATIWVDTDSHPVRHYVTRIELGKTGQRVL